MTVPTAIFAGVIVLCSLALPQYIKEARATHDAGSIVSVAALFAGAALFIFATVGALLHAVARPRIVPYFASPLRVDETLRAFRGGFGLAADLAYLDQLARQANARPLSDFGFSDDDYKQQVPWSDPGDGMKTVASLRQRLAQDDGRGLSTNTKDDLDALAPVLDKAHQQGTQFSLILRLGKDDYIDSVEMDRRQGSFF